MIPKEASQHEANELIICTRCRKKIEDADPRFCPYCGKELFPKRAKARRPNGAGSVTKLSGRRAKPWRARLKHGTISYVVGTFPTSADAMKAIALFVPPDMSQVRAGMTLEDVYRIAVESKAKNLSRSSMETYRAAWRQLEPMKNALVSELKPADYQSIIDGMTGYSRSACEKVRVLVSTIGKWCVANELIGTNPAQFLEMPKKKKKSPENRETFTPEEIETLWTDGSEDMMLSRAYTGQNPFDEYSLWQRISYARRRHCTPTPTAASRPRSFRNCVAIVPMSIPSAAGIANLSTMPMTSNSVIPQTPPR